MKVPNNGNGLDTGKFVIAISVMAIVLIIGILSK